MPDTFCDKVCGSVTIEDKVYQIKQVGVGMVAVECVADGLRPPRPQAQAQPLLFTLTPTHSLLPSHSPTPPDTHTHPLLLTLTPTHSFLHSHPSTHSCIHTHTLLLTLTPTHSSLPSHPPTPPYPHTHPLLLTLIPTHSSLPSHAIKINPNDGQDACNVCSKCALAFVQLVCKHFNCLFRSICIFLFCILALYLVTSFPLIALQTEMQFSHHVDRDLHTHSHSKPSLCPTPQPQNYNIARQ